MGKGLKGITVVEKEEGGWRWRWKWSRDEGSVVGGGASGRRMMDTQGKG